LGADPTCGCAVRVNVPDLRLGGDRRVFTPRPDALDTAGTQSLAGGRARRELDVPPKEIGGVPFRMCVVAGCVLFALFFIGGSGIVLSRGQPEMHHGRYFADDHGDLIPLTKAGYDHEVALGQRVFAAGSAAFLLLSALLSWGDLKTSTGRPAAKQAVPRRATNGPRKVVE
jgi:hypothetical protein